MMKHRWLAAMVVTSAMILAGCKSSSSATNAAASSSGPVPSSAAPSTPAQGANPGSDLCVLLKAEQSKFTKLTKTLGSAASSPDFASTKKKLTAYFDAIAQAMGEVEASMSSAPADVQAALKVVNDYVSQLQSALANASSLTELESSMSAAVADTSKLQAAGATLKAYTTSQCGDLTPSSP